MSSPSSRRVPTAAEHRAVLHEALVEVAERSFFAWVEPVEPAAFEQLKPAAGEWLQASVLFDGAFGGAVQCVLPEGLARDLFNAFLGSGPDAVPGAQPLADLVGEFTNMVCGAWLTRTCQRRRFDLRQPEVSALRADQIVPETHDCLTVTINGRPAYVRLAFVEA